MSAILRRVGRSAALIGVAIALVGCQKSVGVDVVNRCAWAIEIEGTGDPQYGVSFVRVDPEQLRGLVTVEEEWRYLEVWIRPVGSDGDGVRYRVERASSSILPGIDSDFLLAVQDELCDAAIGDGQ